MNLELYGITDQASASDRTDDEIVRALIEGGITILQYRAKKVSAREQFEMALKLRDLTRAAGIDLIINDRVDLAVAVKADGVHLGQDDLPLSIARDQASGLYIGISTHGIDQATAAEKSGADYIGCGPLFATQTKENNVSPIGVETLKVVLDLVSLPVVAIGGIKPNFLELVAAAGAVNIAVVTYLTGAVDVAQATAETLGLWREAKKKILAPS